MTSWESASTIFKREVSPKNIFIGKTRQLEIGIMIFTISGIVKILSGPDDLRA